MNSFIIKLVGGGLYFSLYLLLQCCDCYQNGLFSQSSRYRSDVPSPERKKVSQICRPDHHHHQLHRHSYHPTTTCENHVNGKHSQCKQEEFSFHPVECKDMIGSDGDGPHSPSDDGQPNSVSPPSPLTGSDDGNSFGENKKEPISFPKTLDKFKYKFNKDGQLRHIETNKPFEFNVSDDSAYNQQHYEALGDIITEYVYDLLEDAGLEKVYIPIDSNGSEPQSFIFQTNDALKNEEKLLLLVHGSGVVKAGQWARRLIINDCLKTGSQLPFIERGIEEGYGVIVLNTNLNSVNGQKIKENSTPTEHILYIWKHFVQKAKAKHVAFISHSYGGVVTVKVANKNPDFQSRVFAVAFTDSIHSDYITDDLEKFFQEKSRNWVSSDEPLDTKISFPPCSTPKVSAGHSQHEMTSFSSIDSIFTFLKQKYEEITNARSMEIMK